MSGSTVLMDERSVHISYSMAWYSGLNFILRRSLRFGIPLLRKMENRREAKIACDRGLLHGIRSQAGIGYRTSPCRHRLRPSQEGNSAFSRSSLRMVLREMVYAENGTGCAMRLFNNSRSCFFTVGKMIKVMPVKPSGTKGSG